MYELSVSFYCDTDKNVADQNWGFEKILNISEVKSCFFLVSGFLCSTLQFATVSPCTKQADDTSGICISHCVTLYRSCLLKPWMWREPVLVLPRVYWQVGNRPWKCITSALTLECDDADHVKNIKDIWPWISSYVPRKYNFTISSRGQRYKFAIIRIIVSPVIELQYSVA